MRCSSIFAGVLSSALSLLVCGCATAGPPTPGPHETIIATSDLAHVRAEAARVPDLLRQVAARDEALATLQAQLTQAQQRLGTAPFTPHYLQPVAAPFTMPTATKLLGSAPTETPKKRPLKSQLASSHKGMVVAFWATWCVPCIAAEELFQVRSLRSALAAQGVALVSVAVDSLSKVRSHPRASEWIYPVWQRDNGHLDMLPRQFIATGVELPLFAVVSKDGTLQWVHEGALSPAISAEILTAAMRLKTPSQP